MRKVFCLFRWNEVQKGFTLVELLIVMGLLFVTISAGMVSFSQFSTRQVLDSAVLDMKSNLNSIRSNAVSQLMSGSCSSLLQRYSIKFINTDTFEFWVYCNSTSYLLKRQRLSTGVVFDSGTSSEISFSVSSGISSGGIIRLRGSGVTKSIQVDTAGNIREL